jgi:hypothetical protein
VCVCWLLSEVLTGFHLALHNSNNILTTVKRYLMNPGAGIYVPSAAIAETLHRRRPTPPAMPPTKAHAADTHASDTTIPGNGTVQLTAAERLRSSKSSASTGALAVRPPLKVPSATSLAKNSATQTPVLTFTTTNTTTTTTGPHVPAARNPPSSSSFSPPCNTAAAATASSAAVLPAKRGGRVRYTRQQLLALRPAAMELITRGPIVDHPPFLKIPESFAPLLELPHALEYLNVDAATQLVERRSYMSPLLSSSSSALHARVREVQGTETEDDIAHARRYNCAVCAEGGPLPCPAIQRIIQRASKFAMSTKLGAALMQPALVVESLLRLALLFDAKQSSLRLRLLAERSPRVVHLVEEYLCGEGYHLPLPPVTAHEEWAAMNAMLKFDAIRDNKTRIITDLSKHWKKRRTQFEQFVHFFAFRDARPVRPVKNIVTQSVKPGMVAMLMGDVTAVLLLHRLGFFIPPDYYWSVYPFLRQALGEGTLTYDVVRHLGLYFSSVQPAEMYNPVERPAHTAG